MYDSDDIASLFGFSEPVKKDAWYKFATVRRIDDDGDFIIRLDGETDIAALAMCSANVGDRVLIMVLNGNAYAINCTKQLDYPLTTLVSNQYYTWKVYKRNGIVTVYGQWSGNSGSWFSEVQATLPEGCRPPIELYFPRTADNHGSSFSGETMAVVKPDGTITVSNRGGSFTAQWNYWSFSFAV